MENRCIVCGETAYTFIAKHWLCEKDVATLREFNAAKRPIEGIKFLHTQTWLGLREAYNIVTELRAQAQDEAG